MKEVIQIATVEFKEYFNDLKDVISNSAVRDYDFINNPKLSLLKFSENITCLLEENCQKYVLQINRIGYHTEEELNSMLIWMNELSEELDIRIAKIYSGRDGEILHKIVSDKGISYNYSIQEYLEGTTLRNLHGKDLLQMMNKVGEAAAKLHILSEKRTKSKPPLCTFKWDIQDTLSEAARWGYYKEFAGMNSEQMHLLEKAEEKIKNRIKKYGKNPSNYGLIHADLHAENFLIFSDENKKKLSIIDFDDCGYSWFLYDLASAVSQFSEDINSLVDCFLEGYEKYRKLSDSDKNEISTVILLRR